jgi:hypothetical protein
LSFDLLREVDPVRFKMLEQALIRFVRHSTSPSSQSLGWRRDSPVATTLHVMLYAKALHGVRQAAKRGSVCSL